jgi:hypothetical protein
MIKRAVQIILVSIAISGYAQINDKPLIRSIKTTTYTAIRTVETIEKSVAQRVVVEEFDRQGHLIFERKFDPLDGRPLDYLKKTYDQKGHVILEEQFDEKKVARRITESKYNSDGLVVEILYSEALGPEAFMEFIGSTKLEYLNGLVSVRMEYQKDGSLSNKYSYNYNNKGELIETTGYLNGKSIGLISSFKYDELGNCVQVWDYDANGKPIKDYEAIYDEKSNLLNSIFYSDDGEVFYRMAYTYEFDSFGNIIKVTNEQFMVEGEPGIKTFMEYTYNKYNQKVQILNTDGMGEPVDITEIQYQYWD